jgi:hypothetical protein
MDMQRLRVDNQGCLLQLVNHSSHIMSEKPFAEWGSTVCAEGQITQMLLMPGTRDTVPGSSTPTAFASVW